MEGKTNFLIGRPLSCIISASEFVGIRSHNIGAAIGGLHWKHKSSLASMRLHQQIARQVRQSN